MCKTSQCIIRYLLGAYVFLTIIVSAKPPLADDRVRARELLREALELCNTDCPFYVQLELGTNLAVVGDVDASKKAFGRAWDAVPDLEGWNKLNVTKIAPKTRSWSVRLRKQSPPPNGCPLVGNGNWHWSNRTEPSRGRTARRRIGDR